MNDIKIRGVVERPRIRRYTLSRSICQVIQGLNALALVLVVVIGAVAMRETGPVAAIGLTSMLTGIGVCAMIHLAASAVLALFDIAENTARS